MGRVDDKVIGRRVSKTLIAVISFILIAGVIATILLLNVIYIGVKAPHDSIVVRHVVCDSATIRSYNEVSGRVAVSRQDIQTIEQQRTEAIKKVASIPDMKDDPTCLFIASEGSLRTGNVTEAKEYLSRIKEYADKGIFADTSLYGLTSVQQLETRVQILEKFGPLKDDGVSTGDSAPKN